MRKALGIALVLSTVALAGSALNLDITRRLEITNCASTGSGSDAGTLSEGTYLLRVCEADTFICNGTSCPDGGEKWPQGTIVPLAVPSGSAFSCRSAASTGDIILTKLVGQ